MRCSFPHPHRIINVIGFLFVLLIELSASPRLSADNLLVFVSAFTSGDQGAIHAYNFDTASGQLRALHRTPNVPNPFFLAVSPDNTSLYSIHARVFSGKEDEHVAAYVISRRTGQLKLINQQSSRGRASCYLDVDKTGKTVLVANYTSGSVASLPVKGDGSLGEPVSFHQHSGSSINPKRQKEPHAHCIVVSPDNRYAYVADLGLDQVLCYKLDASSARLTPNDPPYARTPPGSGPRHLTFHPNGKQLYVINELANSITVFDYNAATGALRERQTISTLPKDYTGISHCADVKVTPDGRYLYGTNRGHDSIAAYRVQDDGSLSLIAIEPSRGKGPQNLAISPDGKWLLCANMPGKNIAVFQIDSSSGRIKAVGEPTEQPNPSCIMLIP